MIGIMRNKIENPENNNLPNLNISHIVRGRETRPDHRVIYFPDNNALEGQKVIPEKIEKVLGQALPEIKRNN